MKTEKAQHTPGPWKYNGQTWDCRAVVTDDRGAYLHLCGPEVANPKTIPGGIAEANARLIATAPELLERLKGCANAFHLAMMFSQYPCGHSDDFGRCKQTTCERSRALIAKAEGRGEK